MTAAVASNGAQSVTQVSVVLRANSTESTTGNSGLVFSDNGATYNGRSIALSDIVNDRSGRFTNAQKQQTSQLLQQQKAQSAIASLDQFLPSQSTSASSGPLSPTSLQLLNELNAQGGAKVTDTSASISISVTSEATTAASVTTGSDAGTVSASAASAQYHAMTLAINFNTSTTNRG
jgi:hypothetical protein